MRGKDHRHGVDGHLLDARFGGQNALVQGELAGLRESRAEPVSEQIRDDTLALAFHVGLQKLKFQWLVRGERPAALFSG
jgi:hypothetical protein